MAGYKFTEQAERDLAAIIDFTLAQWGYAQAIKYLDKLEKTAQLLADNPDLGVKRATLFHGLLSFPYESHILYFVKTGRGITIIRVLHQRMDPAQQLSK